MERTPHYILEDGKIKQTDFLTAAKFMSDKKHLIEQTDIDEQVSVSTVFLTIDHGFGRSRLPVLFETMVFGGSFDDRQWRYCTLEEAQVGHQIVVNAVRSGVEPEMLERDDPRWVEEFYKMYTGETD